MRCHKKTKESGFFEGDSSDTDGINMGKAMKRTKVCTTSSESKRKPEYTQDELDSHIRKSDPDVGVAIKKLFCIGVGFDLNLDIHHAVMSTSLVSVIEMDSNLDSEREITSINLVIRYPE
ncbi:unnamed protein product [Diabrotica balteata]|uniref:Uncharacterized protein n=1 Tax=Diabrotica balteata TaxID=107213 RepID=A0A9N9XKK6_DIABA|nr:unnamed protein product [Diabrotica balteata]